MKRLLLTLTLPLALLFSCSSDGGEQTLNPDDSGSIVLSPQIVLDADNISTRATSTDWTTYTVIVTDSESTEVFKGTFPSGGIIRDLPVGNYTVKLTSHPGGFAAPAFDTQVYEGSETAAVTKGGSTPVHITCYQANAGVYFVYDPSLAAAGLDDVVPTVTQQEGALEYSGDYDAATGYFLPKTATLTVMNGSTPIKIDDQIERELDLQAKQLWQITLKVGASGGGVTVTAEIDVTVIDKKADFELEVPSVPVWDKPTSERLNLRGKVKAVSEHVFVQRDNKAYDLEFNEAGWLTKFTHIKSNLTEVPATVTYDVNSRLAKIDAQDPAGAYYIEFTYGTHGKFVTTDEIINQIASANYILPYYLIMPAMLKDIESVKIIKGGVTKWELAFNFGDGRNTANLMDGYSTTEDYFTFTFDGDYIKTSSYEFWGMDTVTTYTLDTKTGCILESSSSDDVVFRFLNDRMNSFVKLESAWTDDAEYELNTNLDIVKMNVGGTVTEFDYDYDAKGNWYNMFNETQMTYIDRTITYW